MKKGLIIFYVFCLGVTNSLAISTSTSLLLQNNVDETSVKKYNQLFLDSYTEDINLAIEYILKAKELASQLENESLRNKWVGETAKNTGIAYSIAGMSDKALGNYFIAIEVGEQTEDDVLLQKVYNNIGALYGEKNDIEQSIIYLQKSADLCMEYGDVDEALTSYLNIFKLYVDGKSLESFQRYYNFVLDLINENDKEEYILRLEDIMMIRYSRDNPEKAILYFLKKLSIDKQKQDISLVVLSYYNLGVLYFKLGDYTLSKQNLDSSIVYAVEIGDLRKQIDITSALTKVDIYLQRHEEAVESFLDYKLLRDSLLVLEGEKALIEMQTKYDTEKKEKENELLRKQGEIDTLEITAQRNKALYLYGGLGVALVLILIILNRFLVSQKQKKLIQTQKEEVELQKELIEEKNTEITDSINYAQRIQKALLKSEEHVTEKFPPHFILFKPKDIVSGDFYWAIEKQGYLYVSVADCTGHGVPGAFMSMLGISFLNEINSTDKILTPASILDDLRERIIRELSQTGSIEGSKDGMDMCIMRLNLENNKLEWAGANNSLYLIRDEKIEEIKADRQPVAYSDYAKPFTNHKVELQKEDSLYMFSDGYVDQFGGPKGKKFKAKRFKEMLLSYVNQPMESQKEIFATTFENWKQDIEQIDDVCIIGMKIR